MSDTSQILGFRFATLLGPIIAVGLFQVVMNEPSSVHANLINTEFIPLPNAPELSIQDGSGSSMELSASSPFHFEEIELAMPVLPGLGVQRQNQEDETDPVFILTTIFPTANKSYAVINGKPRAEGEEVSDGWVLMKISGQERYITLKHTSGRRIRVMMSQ